MAQNTIETPANTKPERGFWAGVRRIPDGLKDGSVVGMVTGGLTAGGLLALDAVFPGLGGLSSILGVDHAALFTAKMAGLHAIAHAGLDAYTEYKEGVRGVPEEKDLYHQYVESLEAKVKTLEQSVTPQIGAGKEAGMDTTAPQPPSSAVVQAILAKGQNTASQASWQDRVAAQQYLQSMQDRTV